MLNEAESREQLILAHLPQVRWIAASIHERLPVSVAEEDLISTGIIGLIQAVDNYDPGRSASLRTYAEIRIRGAILDSLRGLDGVAPHKRKGIRTVQDAIVRVEQRLGRAAGSDEIAAEMGIGLDEYQQTLLELRGVTLGSLDAVTADGSEKPVVEYLADPQQECPSVTLERRELLGLLAKGIASLPAQERLVLDLYFQQELTLAEIARVLDLHLSRISQIKVQAILRLRGYLQRRLNPVRMPKETGA